MNNEVIKWLVGTPASDMNFKTNLKRATAAEIRETLKIIEGRREVKTKEKALRASWVVKIRLFMVWRSPFIFPFSVAQPGELFLSF